VIPFIDLRPVTGLVKQPVLARWEAALDACELVGGPTVAALERALCAELGVAHTIACASGTSALVLALQAAGVGRGDLVALPNLTFWATFEAVAQLGATAVLIDIDPDDLQMSLPDLAAAFERFRFRHAVHVHLYGWASARLHELRAFCRERAVTLVEDGAQSFGVTVAGEPIFAGAELGVLSFYPAKVIGSCMDSGAVLTRSAAHAERIRSLANHGRAGHYSYAHLGWSSRMSAASAGFLAELLPHAPAILAERRALAARYREAARAWKGVRAHGAPAGVVENGYLNVLECAAPVAARLEEELAARGVAARRTYPETMDEQPPAAGHFVAAGELPRSRAFVRRVLNLPLYYGLPAEHERAILAAAAALLT
jgi:dTDP-4-amino-4,6-dideoxygalactose transaminase